MSTDTSEKGHETLIMRHITGTHSLEPAGSHVALAPSPLGGTGYPTNNPKDYDRAHALDVGEHINGKRNGLGTDTYRDGRMYVGEFRDNYHHGQGTLAGSTVSVMFSGRSLNDKPAP